MLQPSPPTVPDGSDAIMGKGVAKRGELIGVQLDAGLGRRAEGSGLGLALTKRLVEMEACA